MDTVVDTIFARKLVGELDLDGLNGARTWGRCAIANPLAKVGLTTSAYTIRDPRSIAELRAHPVESGSARGDLYIASRGGNVFGPGIAICKGVAKRERFIVYRRNGGVEISSFGEVEAPSSVARATGEIPSASVTNRRPAKIEIGIFQIERIRMAFSRISSRIYTS